MTTLTNTFQHTASRAIPALQATIEEYVEPRTGARHIHLASDQPEMAFLVGFPTVPDASDGRAHILEHLSLAGSERYPVRNPFFAMMRRSTATFMNAFTYADRTVYPFASTNRKDFFNLLDIYLDATFFPRLDYLNFLQEGWRYVLKDGQLAYQGVVFNEMKGAFGDPGRALYRGVQQRLMEGTTYAVESGGDPLAIPDLSHQMLKDFHASHYHPSQAVFMSAGNIDPLLIQQQIAERVLVRLADGAPPILPQLAPGWEAPRTGELRVPSQQGKSDEFGIQLAWRLGESSDPRSYYETYLLSSGLLRGSAAPLTKAMESAGFGRPSRLNGNDPSARQMVFHLGMEGLTEPQIDQARTLIWDALERTAREGVPVERLSAALRDLRYGQRDTANGQTPNAMSRLLAALPVIMRGGPVFDAFDSEALLAELDEQVLDPGWFQRLVRTLLDNPTRLEVRVVPDVDYFKQRDEAEQARLQRIGAGLDDAERARIEADSVALDALQREPAETGVLPRIHPADVSLHPPAVTALPPLQDNLLALSIPSNGLSYARACFDVSGFAAQDWPWLRLYGDLVGQLGVEDMSYDEASAWRQRMAPSFQVGLETMAGQDGALRLELTFAASGLREGHAGIAEVLQRSVAGARFDETARIAFLIERQVRNRKNNLAQDGNRYAQIAALAPLSATSRFEEATGGVSALPFFAALLAQSRTQEGLADISARLRALHRRICALRPVVIAAGVGDDAAELGRLLRFTEVNNGAAVDATAATDAGQGVALPPLAPANAALHAVSQINHCMIAWKAPKMHEPGAAALAVAAELMGKQLLHTALREQGGAYGGNANYIGQAGVFAMSSYRDPRLAATYADFDAAIDNMLALEFSQEQLEEAIIGVVKGLDRPRAPYEGVLHAWALERLGVTTAIRQQFRTGVLNCTLDQIRTAVDTWLKQGTASRAAFAGNLTQDLAGLEAVDMLALLAGPDAEAEAAPAE